MIEISEDVVRRTADICGPHSAAARAIKDAERRRATGQTAVFVQERGALFVVEVGPVGAKESK